MELPKHIGYRVVVLSGTRGINPVNFDAASGYCYEIRRDCGHIHRTVPAAERCQHRLLHYSKDRRSCSAAWYNSRVMSVYAGYEDTHLAI